MKTIEQLEAEIAQLQQDLERLKSKPKPIIERTKKYKYITYHFEARSDTDYGYVADNKSHATYNYYPADGELCQRVADYLKRTHLFTRKAIEFAGGYEVNPNGCNYNVAYDYVLNKFVVNWFVDRRYPQVIYMSEKNAIKFAEWCNEHKSDLGYES